MRWVTFSIALAIVILLWVADTVITIYALNGRLGLELNPIYSFSPEAFFFTKGLGVGLLAIIAYELRSRNPALAVRGLKVCTAVLSAIAIWNLVNVAIGVMQ